MVEVNVPGLSQVKSHFEGLEDCYAIIGGTACQIILAKQDLKFRATKDIDLVLIVDSKFDEMTHAVWSLIKDGEYRCGWKSSSEPHFYRFSEPQTAGFPSMIELFSSKQANLEIISNQTIIPLHTSEDLSSLSAILLNKDYYDFMNSGRITVDGITVIDQYRLVPFKAKAYIDLSERKQNGFHVNTKDLTKHKKDVFRLMQIFTTGTHVDVSKTIKNDMRDFIELMKNENLPLAQMGLSIDKEFALNLLQETYNLS